MTQYVKELQSCQATIGHVSFFPDGRCALTLAGQLPPAAPEHVWVDRRFIVNRLGELTSNIPPPGATVRFTTLYEVAWEPDEPADG